MPSQGDGGPQAGLLQRLGSAATWYAPSVLVMIGVVVLWQIVVDLLQVKEYILPTPWAALKTIDKANYQGMANFFATYYGGIGACVLSVCHGGARAGVAGCARLLPVPDLVSIGDPFHTTTAA